MDFINPDILWKTPAVYSDEPWVWITAGVAATLVVVGLIRFVQNRRASWRSRRRMNRAVRGEQRATKLLEKAGWRVVDSQVGHTWTVEVGDGSIDVDLRADHIVERSGRSCVAEVKTGAEAPSVSTAATRRQLLEYHAAFEVDGVLLVDVERETIQRVRFNI